MGRIIIFTGKGGVGKTSVAAAHARKSALEGKKTLIVSTDMAHNLGDIFQKPIGREITQLASKLFALEVDPSYMLEYEFLDMKEAMFKLMRSSSMPFGDLDKLTIFGEEELLSLLKIMAIYESGDFDRIIVDCAPTGETLALLKFPELLSWYIEKLFPLGKISMRVLAPISKAAFKIELPNKAAMSDIESMFFKMMDLQKLLKDRTVTSIRLVAMPEKMVVEETKRNFMYMNLYNFHVDGVFINRILPKDIDNPFFHQWIDIQNQYIEELETVFSGIPIYKIPWFGTDVNGLTGIDMIVDSVMDDEGIFDVVDDIHGEQYEKTETGYLMKLYIPCAKKEALELHETHTDIIIKLGNFKRNIPKPNVLRDYEIKGATFEDELLELSLEKQ